MNPDTLPPKVFVSYSHDSPEHKRWVTELCSTLVRNGVDVILDQWDLGLGDDVPKFMEQSVRSADRVLMICTETYVHKANDGKGGVGYEAMIVTGELVRDLGTSKFIPVVRQKSRPVVLPTSVSTRFYVDLSDQGQFDEQLDQLLRELHQAPAQTKPPIGMNPYAVSPSGLELPEESKPSGPSPQPPEDVTDASLTYNAALTLAKQGDVLGWRELIRKARQSIQPTLAKWRIEYGQSVPTDAKDLVAQSLRGVSAFAPIMAIALAGVGSGRGKFANQLGLLDDILYPKQWDRSGYTIRVDLPESAAFVYQALHGAMCLETEQLGLALDFIQTPFEFPGSSSETIPIWQNSKVMGWPGSFGGDSRKAWNALVSIPEEWIWVQHLFGDKDEYLSALCAYYMALNIYEYVAFLASGKDIPQDERLRLDIPLYFQLVGDEIQRKAYRLLTQDASQVKAIWASMGVSETKVKEQWQPWNRMCVSWLSQDNPLLFFRGRLAHVNAIDHVLSRGTGP